MPSRSKLKEYFGVHGFLLFWISLRTFIFWFPLKVCALKLRLTQRNSPSWAGCVTQRELRGHRIGAMTMTTWIHTLHAEQPKCQWRCNVFEYFYKLRRPRYVACGGYSPRVIGTNVELFHTMFVSYTYYLAVFHHQRAWLCGSYFSSALWTWSFASEILTEKSFATRFMPSSPKSHTKWTGSFEIGLLSFDWCWRF